MSTAEILERIGESIESTATVKSVFGEPIHAEGKTVVPVAKVAYGFGAGSGTGPDRHSESGRMAEGGGGGGGAWAFPAGALEITATGTRFIPFLDLRTLAIAFAAGALFGALSGRRRRR
jgi:uncharacterized spore protein YtfJ